MAILDPMHHRFDAVVLARAGPDEVGLSTAALSRLTSVLEREIERKRLPGAVALIARHGRIGFFESLGVRDPASGEAMRDDSIFRVYSMTKPIVSVAVMMLCEEGRLLLSDPLHHFLPEFADMRVASERDGKVDLVAVERPITIQDLLRHTSGLTYEFLGTAAVQRMYLDAKIFRREQTNAEHAATLATLPLMHQPGTRWEYSRSTDVLGRVIEVISGQCLRGFLKSRILDPLQMHDTDFFAAPDKHGRIAEPFPMDPDAGTKVELLDVRRPATFESGGGGLVSTAADYARFCQVLLNGGRLADLRLLGRKTIEWMTADHLGGVPGSYIDLLGPGYGFGLGFAVRLGPGLAPVAGSTGHYYWGGIAGTTFWIDPMEDFFAVFMMQGPGQRAYFRPLFRNLVYATLEAQ
jgi:CubicO group peptidase (beta-lactamase class C family)